MASVCRLGLAGAVVLSLGLIACGDDITAKPDAVVGHVDSSMIDGPAPDGNTLTPLTLAGTGLCLDASCSQISPDVRGYAPQFPLWSDGATKRRWIYLPPGSKIDTSDMNYWKFPVGTKLWKEFTRDGVRCETRYLVKLADENDPPPAIAWYYVSYQWNLAVDDTVAVTQGAQNVNGTPHDIPSRALCRACHDRLKGPDHDRGRILGIQAIQLDYAAPGGMLDLAGLVAGDMLTDPPAAPTVAGAPFFPLGSTTPFTPVEKAAFGYVQGNCSHCHNPTSDVHDQTPMVLRMDTTQLASAGTTPTYLTTVGVAEARSFPALPALSPIVAPHDPAGSVMIGRMNSVEAAYHMPQAGSEVIDPAGQTALLAWINALP